MMASVSMAARDSLRCATVSLVRSHDRSDAARKVHFLPMRTRLTPRVAYSACNAASAALTSTPSGSARSKVGSSSGSEAANSSASIRRSSSGRDTGSSTASTSTMIVSSISTEAGAGSSIETTTSFLAAEGMVSVSLCVFLCVMRRCNAVRADTLSHVDGRESIFLMDLGLAFAHQLQRRGERRREHGGGLRWLDHVLDQEAVDARPVARAADQPLQRLARVGQRPHRALLE